MMNLSRLYSKATVLRLLTALLLLPLTAPPRLRQKERD
jgi:hypothetical protein